MKTIILTGGGTAGHCVPHFALLDLLYTHFDKIYYIGSTGGMEERLVKERNLPYFSIDPVKLIRNSPLKNIFMPFGFVKSISQAKNVLKELKPDVVFSKGGYVGLPVTISASRLKIPVVIHESDLTLGLANKIASKFANHTLTSFEPTSKLVKNGVYVGSPIRKELFSIPKDTALKYWNLNNVLPVILVTGGSQGAKALNTAILSVASILLKKFQIIHVVGKGNLTNFTHPNYRQVEYADMKYCYSACDYCISRAGANTAFELMALKKPTLFIPLPKGSSRGDQIDNAKYFENKNLSITLLQENLTKQSLLSNINKLVNNKDCLISNMNKLPLKHTNQEICKILCKY